MNAPLRFNEALLIAGHAFEPFQCVAWAAQDGHGELSLTVIDRTNTRIGRKQIPRSACADAAQLENLLAQARALATDDDSRARFGAVEQAWQADQQALEGIMDLWQIGFAHLGELQAAGPTNEQRFPEVQLQRLDLFGDGGLGEVELGGGLGEAQVARGTFKGPEPDKRRQDRLHVSSQPTHN